MSYYAQDTDVPPERTQGEITQTLLKYGAHDYMAGFQRDHAVIEFYMRDRQIRIVTPMPKRDDEDFKWQIVRGRKQRITEPEKQEKLWQKALRQRWRVLLLVMKGRLEAVQSGIHTFEKEFMADFVMPGGFTLAELILPRIDEILSGTLKLPAPPKQQDTDQQETIRLPKAN